MPLGGYGAVGNVGPVLSAEFSPDRLAAQKFSIERTSYPHAWQFVWPNFFLSWTHGLRVVAIHVPGLWIMLICIATCLYARHRVKLSETKRAGGTS